MQQTNIMEEERFERDDHNDEDTKRHTPITATDYSHRPNKEPLPPPPRSDSIGVLRNIMNKNKAVGYLYF